MPYKDKEKERQQRRKYYREHKGLERRLKREQIYRKTHTPSIAVTNSFGYWFAGFVDGEGCFSIKHNGGKPKNYRPEFNITVRADDGEIMQTIQKTLQIGSVYKRQPGPNALKARPGTKPQFRFEVFKISDCLQLVYLLDKYQLQSKKRKDYYIWREAVLLLNQSSYGGYNPEEINRLKTDIQKVREFIEN